MFNKIGFAFIMALMLTSCTSVISKRSDDQAWKEYFNEWIVKGDQDNRAIASSGAIAVKPSIRILRQMIESLPLRDYLVSCESRDCYQSRLVLAFDESFRRVKDQGIEIKSDEYQAEQRRFLDRYSYDQLSGLVDSFHRMALSGIELRAAQRTRDFESGCADGLSSVESVHLEGFQDFQAGLTYLPKAYFRCLQENWAKETVELLDETSLRLGLEIRSPEAKKWIIEKQIMPIYHHTLSELFLSRRANEMLEWKKDWSSIQAGIQWTKPIDSIVREETPKIRAKFRFLNVEALLTEYHQSVN
jgi:hypothetical protein